MARITKIIGQNTRKGQPESEMSITVDYDPDYDTIERIESIEVRKAGTQDWIDVTAILVEIMDFDTNIEAINWGEVYADSLEPEYDEQDV